MTPSVLRSALLWLLPTAAVCTLGGTESTLHAKPSMPEARAEKAISVYFLEIVTPDVDSMCTTLEKLHGVTFSDPQPELGNARTAPLEGGGLFSVRGPLRPDEKPVVRPYIAVDELGPAVEAAKEAGTEIAIPMMEIPKRGKIAIYLEGGIEHGLWEK